MPELVALKDVCEACYQGDVHFLAECLKSEDPDKAFLGDINEHLQDYTALHLAVINGQTEVVQLLVKASADPHIRTRVPYGTDPADGKSALALADEWGWEDIFSILVEAQNATPKGKYLSCGKLNNAKLYELPLDANGQQPAKAKVLQDRLRGLKLPTRITEAADRHVSVALLFPGQGSEVPTMFDGDQPPEAAKLLSAAEQMLGANVPSLCKQATPNRLWSLPQLPVALYLADCMQFLRLSKAAPDATSKPQAVTGFGVGELVALAAAGMYSMEDGLVLAKALADAYQTLAQSGGQAMLSVAGIRLEKLEQFCSTIVEDGQCDVAHVLFPKGYTCSGSEKAMQKLQELAKGAGAVQTKLFTKACALNSRLVASALPQVEEAFSQVLPRMQPTKCMVFMNDGAVLPPGSRPQEAVRRTLKALTSRLQWESCMRGIAGIGVSKLYEVGPSAQIQAMMKRVDAGAYEKFQSF